MAGYLVFLPPIPSIIADKTYFPSSPGISRLMSAGCIKPATCETMQVKTMRAEMFQGLAYRQWIVSCQIVRSVQGWETDLCDRRRSMPPFVGFSPTFNTIQCRVAARQKLAEVLTKFHCSCSCRHKRPADLIPTRSQPSCPDVMIHGPVFVQLLSISMAIQSRYYCGSSRETYDYPRVGTQFANIDRTVV